LTRTSERGRERGKRGGRKDPFTVHENVHHGGVWGGVTEGGGSSKGMDFTNHAKGLARVFKSYGEQGFHSSVRPTATNRERERSRQEGKKGYCKERPTTEKSQQMEGKIIQLDEAPHSRTMRGRKGEKLRLNGKSSAFPQTERLYFCGAPRSNKIRLTQQSAGLTRGDRDRKA